MWSTRRSIPMMPLLTARRNILRRSFNKACASSEVRRSLRLSNSEVKEVMEVKEVKELKEVKEVKEGKEVKEVKAPGRTLDCDVRALGRTLDCEVKALGRTLDCEVKALGRTLNGEVKALGRTLEPLRPTNLTNLPNLLPTRVKIDWESFLDKLESGATDFSSISPEFSTGITLHNAIRLGAPDRVLFKITYSFPEMLHQVNDKKQYPVHVACASGSSPDFVFHCINMNPSTAGVVDKEGRTPIHCLCLSYNTHIRKVVNGKKTTVESIEKNMIKILNMLYQKAPSSVVLDDINGKGAIEYALASNCTLVFVRTLQNMIAHYNAAQARKAKHRKIVQARRDMHRKANPYAAYAA